MDFHTSIREVELSDPWRTNECDREALRPPSARVGSSREADEDDDGRPEGKPVVVPLLPTPLESEGVERVPVGSPPPPPEEVEAEAVGRGEWREENDAPAVRSIHAKGSDDSRRRDGTAGVDIIADSFRVPSLPPPPSFSSPGLPPPPPPPLRRLRRSRLECDGASSAASQSNSTMLRFRPLWEAAPPTLENVAEGEGGESEVPAPAASDDGEGLRPAPPLPSSSSLWRGGVGRRRQGGTGEKGRASCGAA